MNIKISITAAALALFSATSYASPMQKYSYDENYAEISSKARTLAKGICEGDISLINDASSRSYRILLDSQIDASNDCKDRGGFKSSEVSMDENMKRTYGVSGSSIVTIKVIFNDGSSEEMTANVNHHQEDVALVPMITW